MGSARSVFRLDVDVDAREQVCELPLAEHDRRVEAISRKRGETIAGRAVA
jgi:hypothetical protein